MQQFTTPVIVMVIMACFYSGTDSYGFTRKAHMSCFISFFYGKIVIVIYSMLAITIKNFALSWNNKELTTGKNAIWFEPKSQKKPLAYRS